MDSYPEQEPPNQNLFVTDEQTMSMSSPLADLNHTDESAQSHFKALQNKLEELSAEGYLLQPEAYSKDECVKLINSLNAKIEQISVSVVQACCGSACISSIERAREFSISAEELMQIQTIRPLIGGLAYDFFLGLRENRDFYHDGDRRTMYIIRCTIQATLAALCEKIISAWSFKQEDNDTLSSIYISLQKQFDNPALLGTWRSLTRSQSKIAEYYHFKPAAIHSFITETTKVLILSREVSWNLEDMQAIVQDFFHSTFADLYDYCFRLDRVMGESIRSFDTEIYRPEPGEAYNHGSMYSMNSSPESRISSSSSSGDTTIAFSCRLGLIAIGANKHKIDGAAEIYKEEILLKAGIQFENLISDIESVILCKANS